MAEVSYRAFLSYSHRDRQVAEWLHRELETYRVPKRMIGASTEIGSVPARLHPIFKDREELSAAGSLGEAITTALGRASALIVVCSPAAAASPWVNEEVRHFKQLHGDARVFAVIADGQPWASRMPGQEDQECFPPAMRFTVDDQGKLTDIPAEPIAADLRPEGDGKRVAKLKIVAGLIGVGLDELVQREAQRRQRRLRHVAAASLAGMMVTSGLAVTAVVARDEARDQRNEAQHQRAEADGLVEFMLTDLRTKLEPVGRLDVLQSVGDRALDYYARQKLADLDGDSLGRRARAMLLVAEVGDLQGNSEAARRGFAEAARSTAELLERDPDNWQRIYDHAQSEFWLAYDAHNRGDNRAALEHFLNYRNLGRRMMALAPEKVESQVELASSEVNLGVALVRERRLREAIASFDRASATFKSIRPQTRDIALNLNQALGHKASALYALGDNQTALATRREQLGMLSRKPLSINDREVQEAGTVVLAQTGIALLAGGDLNAGAQALHQAVGKWDELVTLDPANSMWRGEYHAARMWSAVALSNTNPAAARQELASVIDDQRRLIGVSPDWVHKFNLLRMIALDRALGGRSTRANEPLVAQAWSRRNALKSDERAVLAAVLISEGDRMAENDRRQASKLWREASVLLANDELATWTMIQRVRVARRLGEPLNSRPNVSSNAFAGVFAQDAGL